MTAQPAPDADPVSPAFNEELAGVLNRHSLDAYCGVPDYLLASFVVSVLRGLRKMNWNHLLNHGPSYPSGFPNRGEQKL